MVIPSSCPLDDPRPRPRFDIGEIFRTHGEEYGRTQRLTPEQWRVMRAIQVCRTAALGGHVDVCDECGHRRPSYNSCRDRHCPKCQSLAQAKWLNQRKQRILPTHYFHVVFTLPGELRPLVRRNPEALYSLLMKSSAQTLLTLGRDEKRLGAQLGITSVLHTWTRKLLYHPHVHCIVTGGGLAPSGDQWVACKGNYLFPVAVMSALFRGKFLDGLSRLHEGGDLDVDESWELADREGFDRFKARLYRKKWVVYAKRPFGGPEQVYSYLGRYTHRVAISNARLLKVTHEYVHFATKHGKSIKLAPLEFIRRFMLHVLPSSFVKIRHYGLLASSNVNTKLEVARRLLEKNAMSSETDDASSGAEPPEGDWRKLHEELTGQDLLLCPQCRQGQMVRFTLEEAAALETKPHATDYRDSS